MWDSCTDDTCFYNVAFSLRSYWLQCMFISWIQICCLFTHYSFVRVHTAPCGWGQNMFWPGVFSFTSPSAWSNLQGHLNPYSRLTSDQIVIITQAWHIMLKNMKVCHKGKKTITFITVWCLKSTQQNVPCKRVKSYSYSQKSPTLH